MEADQISTLLDEGKLADAVSTVAAEVKSSPMATGHRILLAELLVLQGANERADNQLKLAADQAPADMMAVTPDALAAARLRSAPRLVRRERGAELHWRADAASA